MTSSSASLVRLAVGAFLISLGAVLFPLASYLGRYDTIVAFHIVGYLLLVAGGLLVLTSSFLPAHGPFTGRRFAGVALVVIGTGMIMFNAYLVAEARVLLVLWLITSPIGPRFFTWGTRLYAGVDQPFLGRCGWLSWMAAWPLPLVLWVLLASVFGINILSS